MSNSLSYPENGNGYNCNHVTFMIVEIIKLFYMPINGRTFWKKLGTFYVANQIIGLSFSIV